MEDFEIELKKTFLEEAEQLISEVEQCFLDMEQNKKSPANIDRIFRLAHNLKGSANGVGLTDVGEFTHQLETFLLQIKNGKVPVDESVFDLLLRSADHISMMIKGLKENLDSRFDNSHLIQEITSMIGNSEAVKTIKPNPPTQSDAISGFHLFDESPSPNAVVEAKVDSIKLDHPAPKNSESSSHDSKQEQKSKHHYHKADHAGSDDGIRVSLTRVEKLIDFVGEIVILQSVLRDKVPEIQNPELYKIIDQIGKVTKEVQDLSMSLRLVPAKPVFQKLQRIVRDTANTLKKNIHFTSIGADTELDKTVLERIGDPLVHLIRNSCDHGIESAEARLENNKPAVGNVTLKAYQHAGKIVFEVGDDGGGMDPEKILKSAIRKGIVKEGVTLSKEESLELIFKPGFSTKEQVTDISGRGVGMDVVKSNIDLLQGQVQIESEVGIGTTFKIWLPMTLAIIDGMIVRAASERLVIPLSQVHETVRLTPGNVRATVSQGKILFLRDENIPLFDLSQMIGYRSAETRTASSIAIIIRTMEKPYAISVDDIVGRYQVVTKQLGSEIRDIKGVSGSTILGDGKPALILELDELVRSKIKSSTKETTEQNQFRAAG